MRRSSLAEQQTIILPQLFNKNHVGDLVYRFETNSKNEKPPSHLQEILSSSSSSSQKFQNRHLATVYYDLDRSQSEKDFRNEIYRIKNLQNYHKNSESLTSLTDSEFFNENINILSSSSSTTRLLSSIKDEKNNVAMNLTPRTGYIFDILSYLPLPRMSATGTGILFLFSIFICPRACSENLLFPAFRLLFGTLYPAYSSYKAVRTKNVKEYVKWMMYWIVYAFFTCIETFTDIFLSWFPFYYEIKVIIVIWLLSPATKGSSTLYRKFVHPMLTRREQEIDEYLNQAKEKGYTAVLQLGSKGVNYATNVIMQTALKGGGNLVQSIRRSYSLSDLSEPDIHRTQDEIDEVTKSQRFLRPRNQNTRSSSSNRHSEMYFSEVDVGGKTSVQNYNYIRSSEDISSGYSSAEPISVGLSRTSSMTNATRPRFKAKRAEDDIENDENMMRNFSVHPFSNYPPQILFYQNYHPQSSSPRITNNENNQQSINIFHSNLKDLKDEIFLENEIFFQNSPNLEKVENFQNLQSTTTAGEYVKFSSKSKEPKDIKSKDMPEDMKEKYEMFCKWLEMTNEKQNEILEKAVIKQVSEEEYNDAISADSEEETFLDTETNGNVIQKENKDNNLFPTVIQEDIVLEQNLEKDIQKVKDAFSKVIVKTDSTCSSDTENNGKSTEQLADEDNVKTASAVDCNQTEKNVEINQSDIISLGQSIEIMKRPAIHSKGKAPNPPETLSKPFEQEQPTVLAQLSFSLSSSSTSISLPLPPPKPMLLSDTESQSTNSRSPSPSPSKSVSKKSKKNLFKNYLPSLFRSEPSKSNPSSTNTSPSNPLPPSPFAEDLPKETQI